MALRILSTVLLACFLVLVSAAVTAQITLNTGDVIKVDVYNEADLSLSTRIGKEGTIKMPLIGDIDVRDLTVQQVEQRIEAALLDGYLVEPNVSVSILEYRPFYIKGAVVKSGVYDYSVNLTVGQAVAIAGGLKDRASKSKWFVLQSGSQKRVKVTPDTPVYPGDTIEIAESLF